MDLWGTLIEANPKFKERKTDLFEYYSIQDGENKMNQIKKDFNSIIEYTGWQPDDEIILKMMAGRFEKNINICEKFLNAYQKLAEIYKPLLIDNAKWFIDVTKNEYELHLVSNTMFLKGSTLNNILSDLGIRDDFKTASFSDQMGISKPNIQIHRMEFDYFIGDNPITDGVYSERLGSKFIQVHSNNKTLKDAYNIIIENR